MRPLLAILLLMLLAPRSASAHLMPAKQGTLNLVGDSAFVVLSVPVSALHGFDDDEDGLLSVSELRAHGPQLRSEIDRRLVVSDGDRAATTVLVDLVLSPSHEATPGVADQLVVLKHATFAAGAPTDLRLSTDLFGAKDAERQLTLTATRHVGHTTETEAAILTPLSSDHRFFRPLLSALRDYVRAGAEHVLLGADHLLFLLTAVVAGRSLRHWLGVVTAFTLAHSLTLGAAMLGYVHVAPRVVEPLIALSIVVMAVDNLRGPRTDRRGRVALVAAFGLLHGLGFASSMDALGLDRGHRLGSLVGFNVGVELGQALFLVAALGLLALGRRLLPRLGPARVSHAVSLAAIVVGSVWMVQRVLPYG